MPYQLDSSVDFDLSHCEFDLYYFLPRPRRILAIHGGRLQLDQSADRRSWPYLGMDQRKQIVTFSFACIYANIRFIKAAQAGRKFSFNGSHSRFHNVLEIRAESRNVCFCSHHRLFHLRHFAQ